MMKTVTELFMSEYFMFKTVLGKYLFDYKKLFASLSKLYLIPDSEVEELYFLAENRTVNEISTESDFLTYQRMQKYLMLSQETKYLKSEYDEIITIKGNVIISAVNNKLTTDTDATKNGIYNTLLLAISDGNVDAMRIMGTLQCLGIFLAKNKEKGFEILSKTADWNDIKSTLALLHFFKENRAYNLKRLSLEVSGTPYEELYEMALEKYGKETVKEIPTVNLLEKAFKSGVLKREVFDTTYWRILTSSALNIKNKEKILLSQSRDILSTVGDLPLLLTTNDIAPYETDNIDNTALKRTAECKKIKRILKNSDLRVLPSFRPLCLSCDSRYVLNMYAKAISKETEGTHYELIDISLLTEYDLTPSQNNVFVRCLEENKDNRLFLFFFGDISKAKIECIKNILISDCRNKFNLANPNVTLNLSPVLPICFSDEKNANLLKPYCDVINLSSVSQEEKEIALLDILKEKEEVYGVKITHIDSETQDKLCGEYGIDFINSIVDAFIRFNRGTEADIVLTQETLHPFLYEKNTTKIGFGGRS